MRFTSSVSGVSGDPITDGFASGVDFPPELSATPDALTPDPEATGILVAQPHSRTVAIRYPASGQGEYRVVFMGLPFEALTPGGSSPNNPETFLERALVWLMSGADLTPPHAVTGLSLVPSGSSALLTWQPAWDDVAVHHYEVHRNTVPYCVPTSSTLRGTTTATSWLEPGAIGDPALDAFFVVTAVDAAGNVSAPSPTVGKRDVTLEIR